MIRDRQSLLIMTTWGTDTTRASIPLHTLTLKLGIVQLKICKWQIQNHNEHLAHLESDHKNAGVTVAEGSETEAASHATKLKAATANKTQQACWFPMTTTDPFPPHSRVLCENPETNLLLLRSGWSRSYFGHEVPAQLAKSQANCEQRRQKCNARQAGAHTQRREDCSDECLGWITLCDGLDGWLLHHFWMEIFVPGFAAQWWLSTWQFSVQGRPWGKGFLW